MYCDLDSGLDLSYCTNVHPGETAQDVLAMLAGPVAQVRALVQPQGLFGVGLRVSGQAAAQFRDPELRERLRQCLTEQQLYVFSFNGFPHGQFHQTAVKQRVYRPDWLDPGRVTYTRDLLHLLAAIVPSSSLRPDLVATISTVPGGFARDVPAGSEARVAQNMAEIALELWRIRHSGGPHMMLAVEPEPCCMIETIDQAVEFFGKHVYGADCVAALMARTGLGRRAAEQALRDHVGLCFDACHAAVEFEDPRSCVRQLVDAGIPIAKVQVSAGLELTPTCASLEALRPFVEDTYLHQVVVRRGDQLIRYEDLPEALDAHSARQGPSDAGEELWRVHLHVPVFMEQFGAVRSTQGFLSQVLSELRKGGAARQFEVETYTWGVLPAAVRPVAIEEAIAQELAWTRRRLGT